VKALVTGGTGFVGGALVNELLRRNYQVRVLARASSRTAHLEQRGVEIARGDILDRASIEKALGGCEVLFHAAAIYDLWTPDPDVMLRTEVDGTVNALEAAWQRRTPRVVYTSTGLTVGERRNETGTEETVHRGYFLSVYERAKFEAEQEARRVISRGLDVRMVKPSGVLGPGDLKPTGRGLINVLNGRFPMLFHGTLTGVHVEDVALVHALAAEKGQPGREYIAAGWISSVKDWLGEACRLGGKRLPLFGPAILARGFAHASELYARVMKTEPLLSVETWHLLTHGLRLDGSRAARELGVRYKTMQETLADAIAWYRAQGLVT
jgi:dihydroflavonol-4-reductase